MSDAASQDSSNSVFYRYWSHRSATTTADSIDDTVAVQIYPIGFASFSSLAPATLTRYSVIDPGASGPLETKSQLSPTAYRAFQLLQTYWDGTPEIWLQQIEMHDVSRLINCRGITGDLQLICCLII
jgi:hypothetical protein